MAPKPRAKYFTPTEVSLHNTVKDVWVSYLGKVYDLTPLCTSKEFEGKWLQPTGITGKLPELRLHESYIGYCI